MPNPSYIYKERKVEVGGFAHVFNRGVEKRDIFSDDEDYLRFIHDLYEFNDRDAVMNVNYYFASQQNLILAGGYEKAVQNIRELQRSKKRDILVDIIAFCLMPNHFHLIVSPRAEGGLSLFMQKLGTGFTNYFTLNYEIPPTNRKAYTGSIRHDC